MKTANPVTRARWEKYRLSRRTAETNHTMKKLHKNPKPKQTKSVPLAPYPQSESPSANNSPQSRLAVINRNAMQTVTVMQAGRLAHNKEAATFVKKAIAHHDRFTKSFRTAKASYLTAGAFLSKAHALVLHGSWEPLLEQFGLDRSTAHRYEELYTEAMDWARAEHATLQDEEKLFKCALEMVIESPKGLVALCRQLGEMKQFGTYNSAEYEAKKLTQAADTAIGRIDEGTYRRVLKSLDWVVADTLNVEGLGQHSIDQLAEWLEKALHKLRSVKETIPVEAVTTALEGASKPETREPAKAPAKRREDLFGCPHCGRTNFTGRSTHPCQDPMSGHFIRRKGKDLMPMSEWPPRETEPATPPETAAPEQPANA